MNCQDFKDQLYDYLDETLPGDVQARARDHLAACAKCRHALESEKAITQSLRHSLDDATAGISLRHETRRSILEAWESQHAPAKTWQGIWDWLARNPLRPISATAALLGGALLVFSLLHGHRPEPQEPSLAVVNESAYDGWVIDVPLETQSHVFRRTDGVVVDVATPSIAVANARFPEVGHSRKPL